MWLVKCAKCVADQDYGGKEALNAVLNHLIKRERKERGRRVNKCYSAPYHTGCKELTQFLFGNVMQRW